jgi:hypothetical protein
MDAHESPFARVPEPGVHEAPSMLVQPRADIAAAGVAARAVSFLPLALRVVIVSAAICLIVGLPLVLIFQAD